jgi:hypothetical protein
VSKKAPDISEKRVLTCPNVTGLRDYRVLRCRCVPERRHEIVAPKIDDRCAKSDVCHFRAGPGPGGPSNPGDRVFLCLIRYEALRIFFTETVG